MIREVLDNSALLPAGGTTSAFNIILAGHKGLIVNAASPQGQVVRAAWFSPDANSGQGRFICLLRSDLGWSYTQAHLESMRIRMKN